jgi:hypothetical protein
MNFTPETLSSLPLETRFLRCHELSEEALERAACATTDSERADLIAVGNRWLSLATETEEVVRTMWRR